MWRELQAPCPCFGVKARVAPILWRPFGRSAVEPLADPGEVAARARCTVNLAFEQQRELFGEWAQ